VDLFFALSAYLITSLLLRERSATGRLDLRGFYVRRILRIWPLYLAFVAFSAVFAALVPEQHLPMRYVLREIPADGDKPAIKTSAFETIDSAPKWVNDETWLPLDQSSFPVDASSA